MARSKRLEVATYCGAVGATACTVIMLLPVIIGTTTASISGSMAGMASGTTTSLPFFGVFILIAQPLMIASVALILYGMRNFGRLALGISAIGGVLLYSAMFIFGMSLPLIVLSSLVLAAGYGIAYGPLVVGRMR